mmetsp:Transcript_85230/g.236132  ORF Transcript_85230/g.236132 Transcript_85230/m.236132 type:complete len:106 (+) Transcript_85230:132-449(+)
MRSRVIGDGRLLRTGFALERSRLELKQLDKWQVLLRAETGPNSISDSSPPPLFAARLHHCAVDGISYKGAEGMASSCGPPPCNAARLHHCAVYAVKCKGVEGIGG